MNFVFEICLFIYSLFKKSLKFIKKWSDIIIFVPSVILLFVFNQIWMGAIDPTAATLSPEFLSILNFNLVKFGFVFTCSYFVYNLYFHDFFAKGWENKIGSKTVVAAIHLILWFSTLFVSYKIILNGL